MDTVCGIPGSRTEIVMLKPPGDGTRLELSSLLVFAKGDVAPSDIPEHFGLSGLIADGLVKAVRLFAMAEGVGMAAWASASIARFCWATASAMRSPSR